VRRACGIDSLDGDAADEHGFTVMDSWSDFAEDSNHRELHWHECHGFLSGTTFASFCCSVSTRKRL
jgi:hypothetical protein